MGVGCTGVASAKGGFTCRMKINMAGPRDRGKYASGLGKGEESKKSKCSLSVSAYAGSFYSSWGLDLCNFLQPVL